MARDFDVFSRWVSLPGWRKLWLVARALPVRLKWLAGRRASGCSNG